MEPDANLVDLDMRSRPIAEALLPPVLSLAALTNPASDAPVSSFWHKSAEAPAGLPYHEA